MSAPEIERYISVQLAGYDAWLERAREAQQSKRMIKKMETRKLMREQRLRKKLDRARDGGICWEQTGIDYLFVDEAHHYKNLDIRSNNQELDIDGSGRASDLEMKLDYLRTTHGRRVVTFATATPIANSMTEAYVMCRYLRPDLLADAGIEDFDAWTGTFAETTTDVEVAPEGGIRVKDRFARFRNLPELLNMWRVAADVKTKEDLKLPVPELAGGKPEVVPVEPSGATARIHAHPGQQCRGRAQPRRPARRRQHAQDLQRRPAGRAGPAAGRAGGAGDRQTRRGRAEHRPDRARAPRPPLPRRHGNLLAVTGSLQIVFCDLGTPGGKSRWNAYEYLRGKLGEYGTDPRTIRFMHEAKTDKAKAVGTIPARPPAVSPGCAAAGSSCSACSGSCLACPEGRTALVRPATRRSRLRSGAGTLPSPGPWPARLSRSWTASASSASVAAGSRLRAWSQASSPNGAATRCSWVQNTVIQPPFQWSRTQTREMS